MIEYAGKRGLGAHGLGAVDSAFPAALWDMYAKTGIRPEWIVPVLYSESGLNPAATNSIGCVGINQACPFAVPTPDGYTSWPASQQLMTIVTPMYVAIEKKFGGIRSGTRAYQANFLPATLATATSLSSVLARSGGAVYAENSGFDYQHKGTILVSDLAHAISKSASASYPRQVIASAYAQAPSGVGAVTDPVYGLDFGAGDGSGSPAKNIAILVGIAGLGFAGIWAAREWRVRNPRAALW